MYDLKQASVFLGTLIRYQSLQVSQWTTCKFLCRLLFVDVCFLVLFCTIQTGYPRWCQQVLVSNWMHLCNALRDALKRDFKWKIWLSGQSEKTFKWIHLHNEGSIVILSRTETEIYNRFGTFWHHICMILIFIGGVQ